MVVVGIITIIITFAIPSMVSATRSAKEASCLKGLKVIYGATQLYYRDYGYSPVQTSKPSAQFLDEIDPYLPESYAPIYGQNVIIKGYRLFGWVPDDPSHPNFPGVGGGTSSGTVSADRVGYHSWRVVAIPIEPYSGLRTFFLEPNGNVSDTLDGEPV
jgi:type II secretory pathway pseudopilin PulG